MMRADTAGNPATATREAQKEKQMLTFPNSGGGKPFVRLDGRNGTFSLSSPDGEAPEVFPMREKVLVADIKRAEQGWLKLKDGVD